MDKSILVVSLNSSTIQVFPILCGTLEFYLQFFDVLEFFEPVFAFFGILQLRIFTVGRQIKGSCYHRRMTLTIENTLIIRFYM